jgi:MFS superfamily sulfate permease-like transporter
MYRYQAIQMKKEQQDEKVQALKTRNELKEYLDNQVARKNKYFVKKKEETAYWKKKNIDKHAEWKQSIKSDQKKVLAKNLEIKKAHQIQLDQLEARRMKERMILKKEDNVMMSRQIKEKQRVAKEQCQMVSRSWFTQKNQ